MSKIVILAVLSALLTFSCWGSARTDDDVFQQAVNYVFTGSVDPQDAPEITDRKLCIVVVADPKFRRYARYYLSRFKMDVSLISKKYSGTQTLYELDVDGDDIILEYLTLDKTSVIQGFKSAQISLPGNIERTQKAIQFIYAERCKTDQPKTPF
jgi:hypothetical protein